jgi:hypothetical protein
MSNSGFVYILTNPSMPGLVKVGKTTNTPNQRMGELHSTGVPTPFELEFSVSVRDCHEAERSAHRALSYCRISNNREFFRVEPKKAIEKILEVVDEFEVVDFRESHGLEKIEAEIRRRKKAREEEERRRQSEIERQRKDREAAKRVRHDSLLRDLRQLEQKRESLGTRPVAEEPGGWAILALCYLPIPVGWIFWLGSLSIFGSNSATAGLICMILVGSGYFANQMASDVTDRNNRALQPFYDLDEKIRGVERELKALGYTPSVSNGPTRRSPDLSHAKATGDVVNTDGRGFEKPARKIGRMG